MEAVLTIRECPNCGSDRIRRVRKRGIGEARGRKYAVPNLSFYECPNCGEKVYDREAMRRIEACSPAFRRKRSSSR